VYDAICVAGLGGCWLTRRANSPAVSDFDAHPQQHQQLACLHGTTCGLLDEGVEYICPKPKGVLRQLQFGFIHTAGLLSRLLPKLGKTL